MSDLRLAVIHPNAAERDAVAGRIRGATFVADDDPVRFRGPPYGPDAAIVVGMGQTIVEPLLTSGIHVLLVADPCPPRDAVQSLYAVAQLVGVKFAAINPDRYLPSRQLVRMQIPTPLGEPGLIRSHRWEPRSTAWDGLPDPLLRDVDVVLWLAGRRPDRVFAIERSSDEGSVVQVHLGFPGGGSAMLDYTDRLPPGDGYQSLSAIAAHGAAYADDQQNVQLVYRGGNPQAVRTEERARQFAAMAQDFVDAIQANRDLPMGLSEWETVFSVAVAVRRSLASGQAVVPEGH